MFDLLDPSKKPSEPKENHLALEEKLFSCLDKMQISLEQEPNLTQFWQAKKECVLLFKEKLAPQKRTQLWQRYIKLSEEGRVVRDFLDEEAGFAIEQIELAIADVEKQAELIREAKCSIKLKFPEAPQALTRIYDSCCHLQNLIHQTQLLTIRLQELRKEVSLMSMRMKIKGNFFDRLSFVCDTLFPKRNEMISILSEQFAEAIKEFVVRNFSDQHQLKRSCYHLQNEIREMQAIAKQFSLSTKVFTDTRKELSRCWDQLKEIEKEKKENFSQLKEQSDLHVVKIEESLQRLSAEMGSLSEKEVRVRVREIQKEMQSGPLLRKQIAILEKKCQDICRPFEEEREKVQEELREKKKKEQFLEDQNVKNFLDRLAQIQQTLSTQSTEHSQLEIQGLQHDLEAFECSPPRKKILKARLKEVLAAFSFMQERKLLSDVADSQEHQQKLSEVLQAKLVQRDQLKTFLENCRKERGKSGLDFQQAMELSEKIEKAKTELQAVEQSILDFDHKIDSFT